MRKILLLIVVVLSSFESWAEGSAKFLDSNKVWEYGYEVYSILEMFKTGSLYRYEIEGTEEYNGKTYNVLWQTKETVWTLKSSTEDKDCYDIVTNNQKKRICLLREENNKVYMPYLNDGPVIYEEKILGLRTIPYFGTENRNASQLLIPVGSLIHSMQVEFTQDDEIMLFNFNAKDGDKVNLWGFSNCEIFVNGADSDDKIIPSYTPCLFEYTVNKTRTEMINLGSESIASKTFNSEFQPNNPLCKEYQFNSLAGSVGDGAFILGPMVVTNEFSDGLIKEFWFNNLYDKEGNVIFEGGNIRVPENNASVLNVEADARQDARMYDVMGREIRNPQPGTIYIQNGRKLIAR